jgi:hypothetical protein
MKNLGLIIFFTAIAMFSCTSGTSESGNKEAAVQAPKTLTTIQWLDSAKQIGKITEGEKVEIAYRFVNTGNSPLVIENVVATCGCTVAEKPAEPVAPGKEGLIKAVFDSHGRPGSQHKSLTVYANTETMIYPLTFDVEVLASNK